MPVISKSAVSTQLANKSTRGVAGNSTKQKGQRSGLLSIAHLTIFIGVVNVLSIILLQKYLPPELPLFYGLPEGEGQLTTNLGLVIPGGVTLATIVTNLILAKIVKDEFLKQVLIVSGFAVAVFCLATTLKILFLVGSL